MSARVHSITLPVNDLEASLDFYRVGLGMVCDRKGDHAVVAVGEEVILILLPRDVFASFAEFAGQRIADTDSCKAIYSYFTSNEAEVEEILDRAAEYSSDGEPPEQRPWGYSGYLADPDGHVWEIVYSPVMPRR